jgi:Mlc titration factor MtfA (ptsG expression regulator)
MFNAIHRWLDRRVLRSSDVSPAQWAEALAALPLLRGYSAEEKDRLRELATLFLHRKMFEGADGFVVSQTMTLIIALQACIPVLELGLDCYDGWVSVIVYPASFAPKRVIRDEYGVEHSVQSHLSGESWQRGPVVLAWDATAQAGVIDGHNLVIHEFAHKLDMQTGSANGFPPLHTGMSSAVWFETFSAGFEDFQAKCGRGESVGIDCYAASSPAEFFAVFSEVFFERPELLRQHYAEIYELLRQYYRQDPLTRLGDA